MENFKWLCQKSIDGYKKVDLEYGDTIDEINLFAVSFQSSQKLSIRDYVLLITDFHFELEEKELIDGYYNYEISEYSLNQYFINEFSIREEVFKHQGYIKYLDGARFSKLFVNYPIGLAELSLYDQSKNTIISEFKFNINSAKLNLNEFKNLVDYVEGKSVALWAKYSLSKQEATPDVNINKNDCQFIFIQDFIN